MNPLSSAGSSKSIHRIPIDNRITAIPKIQPTIKYNQSYSDTVNMKTW